MKYPNLFIVGAPKAGTTSMHHYLADHPQIFMAPGEPHYFGSDLSHGWRPNSETDYMSMYNLEASYNYLGEKSVFYLLSHTAAQEIRAHCPAAKIIIMLRNPIEALPSLHGQFLRSGNEDIADFAEALAAQKTRAHQHMIPRDAYFPLGLQYQLVFQDYKSQVERYVQNFGRDSVHIILYDDFRDNVQLEYHQVLEFLMVDTAHKPAFSVHLKGGRIRSRKIHNLLQTKNQRIMPDWLWRRLRWQLTKMNQSTSPAPDLPKPLKEQLQKEFKPDIDALSNYLGRDLSEWYRS